MKHLKHSALTKIVNKHDPMGLLGMGCPDDEYSPEVKIIIKRLKKEMNTEEITQLVNKVFHDMFSMELKKSILSAIVKDIQKEK